MDVSKVRLTHEVSDETGEPVSVVSVLIGDEWKQVIRQPEGVTSQRTYVLGEADARSN